MTGSKTIGTLWTDYEDDESEAHYEASVTHFVKRESEISIEFSGHDPDEGAYTGWCRLAKNGERWTGTGEFFFAPKNRIPARVSATLTSDETHYFLTGDWLDQGDEQSADLEVEFLRQAIG
jgi:hypothetical protein